MSAPTAKKKVAKKKKTKSKHVLKAEQNKKNKTSSLSDKGLEVGSGDDVVEEEENQQQQQKQQQKRKRKSHVKDPAEAALYLAQWKESKSSSSSSSQTWKFNKNTQSWLIRHMYEADKLSKSSFGLLLEYLQGMKGGEQTKERIRSEASRRALRYREYEKNGISKSDRDDDDQDDDEKDGNDNNDHGENKEAEGDKTKTNEEKSNDVDEVKDEADRWEKLSDHDKRKEYKRARKVLEIFKNDSTSN